MPGVSRNSAPAGRKAGFLSNKYSREVFQVLSDRSPNMIFINRGGKLVYVNRKCEEIMGYSKKEFYAPDFNFMDLISGESRKIVSENYALRLKGDEIPPYEYIILTKSGKKIAVIISSAVILYEGKKAMLGIVTDITRQKETERQLQKEKERMQRYLDIAGFIFVVLDAEGNVNLINKQGCEILGYQEEELKGKNWFDCCVPERYKNAVKNVLSRIVRKEISPDVFPEFFENPVLTRSGQERMIAWHNTFLKDDTGNLIYALSAGEDITERLSREKRLRESENKFRTLAETTPVAIFIHRGGNFLYVNKATEEISGYSREELLSKSFGELVHPEFRKLVEERAAARLRGETGITSRYEIKILRKDGKERFLDLIGTSFSFSGAPHVLGTAIDITEKKIAESELKKSEIRYKNLLQALPDIAYHLDRKGNITFINDAVASLGYTPEELTGRHFSVLIHPDYIDRISSSAVLSRLKGKDTGDSSAPKLFDERRAGSRKTRNLEVKILGKDSSVKDAVTSFITNVSAAGVYSEHEENGKKVFLGTVGIIRDITEKKMVEEALRTAYEDLENTEQQLIQAEKMSSLGVMAGGVAHELNTPLSAILGYSSLLMNELSEDTAAKKDVHEIEKAARKCKAIVENMLHFSRQDFSSRFGPVDIEASIEESLRIVKHRMELRGIQIEKKFQAKLPAIQGNSQILEQAFINLMNNAHDAMPRGGTLFISAELLENSDGKKHISVQFRDTGTGIPDEIMQKIFDPFVTTKPVGEGTGLGLSVTYGIIKKHHGRIEVKNMPEGGALFTVFIPVSPESGGELS